VTDTIAGDDRKGEGSHDQLGSSGLPRRGRGLPLSSFGNCAHGNKYTPNKEEGEAVLWRAVCPQRPATCWVR